MGKKWIVLVFAACSFFYTHGQVSGYLGKRLGIGLTNATQLSLNNPIGSTSRLDEIPASGFVHNPALGLQYALSRRTSVGVSAGVFQTGLYVDNLYAGFLNSSSTIGLVVNAVGLYRLNCQTVQMEYRYVFSSKIGLGSYVSLLGQYTRIQSGLIDSDIKNSQTYDESDLEFNVTNSKYGVGVQLGRIFSLYSTLLLDVSCTAILPANLDNPSDGSPFNLNPKSDNYLQYQSSLSQRIGLMQAFQVKVGLWFFCL